MIAGQANLLDFIKKSSQFAIPIYQRSYSWTEKECRQLWDDIIRTGGDDKIAGHFLGSIVYIQKGLYHVTGHTPLLVIDGQQRLATITLIIACLAETIESIPADCHEPHDGFTPRKLRNYYLINPEEEGDRRHKLILSHPDRDALIAIINRKDSVKSSIRLDANRELILGWLTNIGNDLNALCKGLAKLVVVDIALTRGEDDPQLIFESMNSTGRELTQADLIRNYILMNLEPAKQNELYEFHWRPMEEHFGQDFYAAHFDAFIRHYLTMKTGVIPNISSVYEAFKSYARSPEISAHVIDVLLQDIATFAGYFCNMAFRKEKDAELKSCFSDLSELKVDVAYPLLLELYDDYQKGLLPKNDFIYTLRLIESYVFRRAVCGIPTNSLNKVFSTFSRNLPKDRYLEGIQAHLMLLPSYRKFPTDEEFRRELQTRDIYNFRNRRYLFRKLENYDTKEPVNVNNYTIEHILPQNPNLSQSWRDSLGPEWKRIHEELLHTIGNLTLTGYNSEYGAYSFTEKRDMKGGFRQSTLRLNRGLGDLTDWNEPGIKQRASSLAAEALNVWTYPQLCDETLDRYRPLPPTTSKYSLNDHPHLLSGPSAVLFNKLRSAILELNPVIREEILKLYVAYKAETNFVDIQGKTKLLRLTLNMKFNEIHDPLGLCKDITNLGRWGNGDIEVDFDSVDDIPYIMGLIRQSFEKQLQETGAS